MTVKELEWYSWNEKAAKRGEEEPIKDKDHACDALRMGVMKVIPKYRLG